MEYELRFEKYQSHDFSDYYSLVKDDDVMKYITGKGMSVAQAKKKFESNLEISGLDDLLGYFKILDDHSKIVGECKLVRYKHNKSLFEIGYLLKKEFWKKGLGTQICEHMLALSSSMDPNQSIIGIINPRNTASRKLLEKFGFESYFVGIEDDMPTEKLILKRQ